MPPKRRTSARATQRSSAGIVLIGLFKLFKGLLLLAAGLGMLRLLHRDVAETVNHWIQILRVDPDNHYVHQAISRVINVTPKQLRELSVGSFIYAALLLTEGIGLLARKHWAEYVTVISTALFIPLELYELSRHVTVAKVVVLVINVVVVWYLVRRLKRTA